MGPARITVVGLGPAGADLTNDQTRATIASIPHRYLRTSQHPSASVVPGAITFDDVYDSEATFDKVYATIVERLVDAATEQGHILYAVPGSPLVLERTVGLLRNDQRVDVELVPAMSFLDVA